MQYRELGILQLYKIDETIALQKHQDHSTSKEGKRESGPYLTCASCQVSYDSDTCDCAIGREPLIQQTLIGIEGKIIDKQGITGRLFGLLEREREREREIEREREREVRRML